MNVLKPTDAGWFMTCAACGINHVLPNYGGWHFTGTLERPTFTPSFKLQWEFNDATPPKPAKICHFIITDGRIQYCADSTHALAGQTLPMVAFTSTET